MIELNIVELKNNLGRMLSIVEKGERIQVCRRNIPIAHIVPLEKERPRNKTRLGCGRGTVQIQADLTEPMIPEEDWDMLKT